MELTASHMIPRPALRAPFVAGTPVGSEFHPPAMTYVTAVRDSPGSSPHPVGDVPGRSPGSRVVGISAFPGLPSGISGYASPLTVAGAATASGRPARPCSHFHRDLAAPEPWTDLTVANAAETGQPNAGWGPAAIRWPTNLRFRRFALPFEVAASAGILGISTAKRPDAHFAVTAPSHFGNSATTLSRVFP